MWSVGEKFWSYFMHSDTQTSECRQMNFKSKTDSIVVAWTIPSHVRNDSNAFQNSDSSLDLIWTVAIRPVDLCLVFLPLFGMWTMGRIATLTGCVTNVYLSSLRIKCMWWRSKNLQNWMCTMFASHRHRWLTDNMNLHTWINLQRSSSGSSEPNGWLWIYSAIIYKIY